METPGFTNLHNIEVFFKDQQTCWAYLEKVRWSGQPACPRCGSTAYYPIRGRKTLKCKDCANHYNVLTGTVYENTKIPLLIWFKAMYIVTSHKKGISSLQLGKDLGITQKSAWFLLGRIRKLAAEKAPFMLDGTCEVDETYVGGKEGNRNQSFRAKQKQKVEGKKIKPKAVVFGVVQRDGKVITVHVPNAYSETLLPIIKKHIAKNSTMYSDEYNVYKGLKREYNHESVSHSSYEFVRGEVHTCTLDGYWSNLKRGINGIFHQVSQKHLFRYCDEFAFRYNHRDLKEVDKFKAILQRADHTRLRYCDLIQDVEVLEHPPYYIKEKYVKVPKNTNDVDPWL